VHSADFDWASRHSLVVLANDSLELRDEQAVRVQLPASLSGNVDRAAFCSGGRLFLASRKDGLVEVFDRASGEQVGQPWGHDGPLSNLVVSDAGDKVATVRVDRVMVWDVLTGSSSSPLVHGHLVKDLAFHPDGSQLATAGARGQVIVWDLAAARPVRDPIGHEEGVSWVRFLDGGRSLLSVTESGTGYLWELGEPGVRKGLFRHGSPLTALAHDKEGTSVATAGTDLNVRIWDARLGEARTGLLAHPSAVNDLVFHPSLPILATAAADGMTRIWDVANGELLFEGFAHLDAIRQVEFGDDGSVLSTVGAEGAVCFWSLGWDGEGSTGEVAEFVRAASPLPQGDLPGLVRRREQHGHHFEVSPLRRRSWLEQRSMADRRWDSREAGLASREGNWERAIG
ncbi:MAG: WD40 repeat domain-containing protein, partial [Akkermansiaceae bacterium]|nr:WD40 repeat domain-containing protein [Akkermansiaceae bacterium]